MKTAFLKVCKVHGETDHRAVKRKGQPDREVCVKCRSEAVRRRRVKLKQMALDYKGNVCQCCGYDKCAQALEFHHVDDTTKEFGISESGETRSWKRLQNELDKCILVCSNCHKEIHAGFSQSVS